MIKQSTERLAYSVREVSEMLGMSQASINLHIKTGAIPSAKIGGRRFIRRDVLEAMLRGEDVS